MLTRTRAFLTATMLAAAAAVALPSAAGAATAGTAVWTVSGAQDLGALPARAMTITLALTPRDASGLKAFVSAPHAPLTPAEFVSRFGPSPSTVAGIASWAAASGLSVDSVAPNRLLVQLSGSSTAIGRALGTSFDSYSSPSTGTFFQITRPATLPQSFASQVGAVMGLSDLGRVSVQHPVHPSSTALAQDRNAAQTAGVSATSVNYPAQYGPKDFWSMYDAPSGETGSGQQLAIITEGDVSQPKADLATFEQTFGLPTVTWNQINVGAPSTDTSGDDEWDLDSQYSTAFAPGVSQLDVYVGPSLSDQDIATTINRFVTDDISNQGSFSASECEILADAAGFITSLDPILEQADAQGQSMFFSTGDTGSQCPAVVAENGVPAGIPGVSYPASSPYGIAVGGTSVLSPSGPTELAWYAGGGGTSLFESTPAFQSNTAVGGVAPLELRGVPDVSLDADPESGYEVIVSGTEQVIGGTSASTPSWQGIWARAQGAHGGTLGFAGPVIYITEPASAFNDITLGANGLFTALPGWDYTTGRGTPNITAFVNGA
jgi:subtilase family serine protease